MVELVGQLGPRRIIERAIDDAEAKHGSGLLVVGEAGAGKTALLEHAAAIALAKGFAVRRVIGTPHEQALPYAGLHALIASDIRKPHAPALAPPLAAAVALS